LLKDNFKLLLDYPDSPFKLGSVVDMPLYEYELENGEDCKVCGGRFTLRRPLTVKPLTNCPLCKKSVKKLISGFNTPTITKPVSISDAKKAGFTVLKKTSKGEYERQ